MEETKAEFEIRTQKRSQQLHGIGMAMVSTGFLYRNHHVLFRDVAEKNDEEWVDYFTSIAKLVNKSRERVATDMQMASTLLMRKKTDKELMKDFSRSLAQITGPELESEEARLMLKHTLILIHEAKLFNELATSCFK
ncbi:MAG: hypothetical protein M3R27_08960 [Bacteroidota bacterium]|nr:hypothetical protein [Bacteroidota bacterium]